MMPNIVKSMVIGAAASLLLAGCSQQKDGVSPDAAKCGVCHQMPPATAAHQGAGSRNCGTCHTGYDSATTVSATHNNGVVDVAGGCGSCHRAPPDSGTHALSYHAAVRNRCGACHIGYDSTTANTAIHRNDTVDTSTAGRLADSTCRQCHTASGLSCAVCHDNPPATGTHARSDHAAFKNHCAYCHAEFDSVTANAALHRNSTVDTSTAGRAANTLCQGCHTNCGGNSCASCHDFPPTGSPHPAHLGSMNYDCNVCHPGGASKTGPCASGAVHRNDTVNIAITYPFTITPSQTNTALWIEATRTCASVYCHGKFTGGNGTGNVKADTTVTCGGCHALPPSTAPHTDHGSTIRNNCSNCHTGYSGTTSATYGVNASQHVNGTSDWTDSAKLVNTNCGCHQ